MTGTRKISENNKRLIDYLIILGVLFLGLWQLAFFRSVMKWDIVDINLPWNYFISECMNHGILPLWNPYSMFGFPQYGDPATWYPVNWVIGLIRQYDLYAVHFEYLLHLFLAAIGMYKLGFLFGFSRNTRLIVAISYMFSGFFISNAQHIWWLINATWLPFIFLYFIRLYKIPTFSDSVKLAFVIFLALSGGYPGLFISTAYLFLAIFCFLLIKNLMAKNFLEIKKWLLFLSITCIFLVFSSLVVFVSSFDFSHYINRGVALPYNKGGTLFGSFPPKALLSAVFPYSVSLNDSNIWGADFSVLNIYFGFFCLLILLITVFAGKISKKSLYYFVIGIVFLLIAMAEVFPFRKWLYLYIPYMDMFRFSSIFRLFAIFFFILATGFGIEKLNSDQGYKIKFVRYGRMAGILLFLSLLILFFNLNRWKFKLLFTKGFSLFDHIAGINEKIFLQGVIHIGLLGIFLFIITWKKTWWYWALTSIVIIDMILSVQLNINATVTERYSPKIINNYLKKLPAGFPIPSLTHSINNTNDKTLEPNIPYIWRNLGELYKTPSSSSFSPYRLNTVHTSIINKSLDNILDNPIVFLTKPIIRPDGTDFLEILPYDPESLQVTLFKPNRFEMNVNLDSSLTLVLLQNYYPYWTATVNEKKQSIIKIKDTFMSLKLGKGEHHLVFEFKIKKVMVAFWISLITWGFCLIIIGLTWIKKSSDLKNQLFKLIFIFSVLILFIGLILINMRRYHVVKNTIPSLSEASEKLGNDTVSLLLNIDTPFYLPKNSSHYATIIRPQQKKDMAILNRYLQKNDTKYLLYAQVNAIYMPEAEWLIHTYYPREIVRKQFGTDYFVLLKKETVGKDAVLFHSMNDFEKPAPGWSINSQHIDTVVAYSGEYSNKIDSINIYSSTFNTTFSKLPPTKNNLFRITLKALTSPTADPLIIFQVIREGKTVIWKGEHIRNMITCDGKWNNVCMFKHLYENVNKNDNLRIYVWNNSKGNVWIDDFKIEIID